MGSVRPRGFTLIELMLVIVILVVIIVIAVPSFVDTLERRKIVKATQALTSQIQQARSLAITRNTEVTMVVTRIDGADWCFGLTDAATCDCQLDAIATGACTVGVPDDPTERVLIRADESLFAGVQLGPLPSATLTLSFEPTRGLRRGAAAADTFDFESDRRGARLTTRVNVNPIGRITTCSPSGSQLPGGIGPC